MALAAQNAYVQHEYSTEELEDFHSELEPQTAPPSAKSSTHRASTSLASASVASTATNRLSFPDDQAQHNDQAHNQSVNHKRSRLRHHADDADLPRSYREFDEWKREETAAPRRAALRSHRAFRMTWATSLVGAILFAQLLGALWLKALAVSSSHHADDLEKAIATEEANIDKTQRKISLISSDPRMASWAEKAGYRAAAQSDLDNVMNAKPLPRADEYSKAEEGAR